MNNLIFRAALFAEEAHRGQPRKYTCGEYIEHPRRVAAQAAFLGLSDEAIAAAFLHDVVEDCKVSIETINELFGTKVGYIVLAMTDLQDPATCGNRAQRQKVFLEQVRKTDDPEVHTLKILDITDNARSIAGHDPKFWFSAVLKESRDAIIALDKADKRAVKQLSRIIGDT